MGLFQKKKTIGEIEEESERADAELGLKEKQLLIQEMDKRYGKGGWQKFFKDKHFSSGIDWNSVKFSLRGLKK